MAEALAVIGIIASIVQLVDFGSKILSRLNEFQSTAGEIPQSFCNIKSELPVLLDSLRHTKEAIEAGSIGDETKKALLLAIEGCRVQIKALDDVLLKVLPTLGDSWRKKCRKAVSVLYYEGKVEKIARVIRNYIQTLTFYHATTSSTSRPLTGMLSLTQSET
jgi:N-terminal domain on NACHT_NTPase and P-loop NTPases